MQERRTYDRFRLSGQAAVVRTGNREIPDADLSGRTAQTSSDSSDEDENSEEDNSSSVKAVHTGDPTNILPFVILAIAAAAIVGVIVYLRKRKK